MMKNTIILVNRILQEHKEIMSIFAEINKRIEKVISRAQNLQFYDVSQIVGKVTYLITLILDHEAIEEGELYPIFEDLGYITDVEKLRNDHRQITKYLNDIRRLFENYAHRKIDLKKLLDTVIVLFNSLYPLFKEHIDLEEKIIKILNARLRLDQQKTSNII